MYQHILFYLNNYDVCNEMCVGNAIHINTVKFRKIVLFW